MAGQYGGLRLVRREPPEDVYFEGITRTNATRGAIAVTFTPLRGLSAVVARYLMEKSPDRAVITMTIEEGGALTLEDRQRVIDSYPAHEREARTRGVAALGSGRIFPVTRRAYVSIRSKSQALGADRRARLGWTSFRGGGLRLGPGRGRLPCDEDLSRAGGDADHPRGGI